ncbi:hypothetical protein [Lysinibacillus sp. BW-2-10]|uniref:hypothetical protein n=1 Tax=Lysinibacillus sp. BW-2-10 TaxID=2590030 RepID=UPI00117CCD05|nr:hypothetical protein [Lysinibacillus sp. BW-2-10]TSI02651.1 hypothetical protein FJQ64_18895 [Lysinibacillus sp. BW-2-10]
MPILNSQYAFLEADYTNPNLTQVKTVITESSNKFPQQSEFKKEGSITKTNFPPTMLLNVNWLLGWLIALPVDIYCIAIIVMFGGVKF